MDWLKLESIILHQLYRIKRYWKFLIFALIIGILFRFIRDFLTGKYIAEASIIDEYLLVLLIGKILSFSFYQAFGSLSRQMIKPRFSALFILYSGFTWFIFFILIRDFVVILLELVGYFLLPVLFGLLSMKIIIYSTLFSFVILFLTYGTSLMLSPLFFKLRSEGKHFLHFLRRSLIQLIIPVGFMMSYFWFYKYLWFFPPTIFVEEFRKIIMGLQVDEAMLIFAFILSITYYFVGYLLFKKSFENARRKGYISLL